MNNTPSTSKAVRSGYVDFESTVLRWLDESDNENEEASDIDSDDQIIESDHDSASKIGDEN